MWTASPNSVWCRHSVLKTRIYDEANLSLGFTSTMMSNEESPQCVACLKILVFESEKKAQAWLLEREIGDH